MIKITGLHVTGPAELLLSFSDGTSGLWSAAAMLARDTVLTRPLREPAYFTRAFIEGGALAWPNGLEFSPAALHAQLGAEGKLRHAAA